MTLQGMVNLRSQTDRTLIDVVRYGNFWDTKSKVMHIGDGTPIDMPKMLMPQMR